MDQTGFVLLSWFNTILSLRADVTLSAFIQLLLIRQELCVI